VVPILTLVFNEVTKATTRELGDMIDELDGTVHQAMTTSCALEIGRISSRCIIKT
jgi:hypothetical protein